MQSASMVTAVPVTASVPPATRDALPRAPLHVLDALVLLAGAALAVTSGWALWMGLVHDTAPWCLAPT